MRLIHAFRCDFQLVLHAEYTPARAVRARFGLPKVRDEGRRSEDGAQADGGAFDVGPKEVSWLGW